MAHPRRRLIAAALGALCVPALADPNTKMCIKNTGGSCLTTGCYTWRDMSGKSECDNGRCFCDSSSCAGLDGSCWDASDPYLEVNNEGNVWYKFRNMRKNDLYLRTSTTSALSDMYATSTVDDASYFSLVLPQVGGAASTSFLVYSKQWPDAVLTFDNTKDKLQCSSIVHPISGSLSLPTCLTDIVKAPADVAPGAVMLKRFGKAEYAYLTSVHTSMNVVETYNEDPGTGGYWFPEPALPDEIMAKLPVFSGQRCSWSCGSVNAAASFGGLLAIRALALALLVTLVSSMV